MCPCATPHGLVIVPCLAVARAHGDIVHRALACCRKSLGHRRDQRAAHHVDDAHGGLYISRCHGGRSARVDQATRGCLQRNRVERALRGGRVGWHQAAEHVVHRGRGHRHRAVDVTLDLLGRAGEVHRDRGSRHVYPHANSNVPMTETIVVEDILEFVSTAGDLCKRLPGDGSSILIQSANPFAILLRPVKRDDTLQTCESDSVCAHLGKEVVERRLLFGGSVIAVIVESRQQLEGLRDELAVAFHHHRGYHESFLFETSRDRHRAGGCPSDVGVVSAVGHECNYRSFEETRCNEGDVRQMRPTQVRIVENHHVTGLPVQPAHHVAHRKSHAAQVHGYVRSLGEELSLRVEQRTGEIQSILDVG